MAMIRREKHTNANVPWFYLCCILLLSNLLVYQWASSNADVDSHSYELLSTDSDSASMHIHTESATTDFLENPFAIPRGAAKALPSIRTKAQNNDEVKRSIYGGAGDKKHLGGFTDIDTQGISPRAWKWMVQRLNIRSVLDVGCGRGISTSWFAFHGLDILCVEGSHDARERTMLPDPETQMVEHDFSRGPWWPGRTFDAVWCVEFLEHVSY